MTDKVNCIDLAKLICEAKKVFLNIENQEFYHYILRPFYYASNACKLKAMIKFW